MKRCSIALLLCLCLLLSGCTEMQYADSAANPVTTLAPALHTKPAPVGFDALAYNRRVALYLPSKDGKRIIAQHEMVSLHRAELPEEAVVRALVAYPTNDEVLSLGFGSTILGLYGDTPVKTSEGICTVNLASSILQLEYYQQYAVCLCLASTLRELDNVRYVNVLVADQPLSLDISGNLPAGSIAAHPGEELSVLWEQTASKATPLGQNAANTPLSAAVTLYFPLADGTGYLPETRTVAFSGQSADVLTEGLMDALSVGSLYLEGTAAMPDISSLFSEAPTAETLIEGGKRVTLHFLDQIETRLQLLGLDPVCFMASLVSTITTFVPSVASVQLESGGVPLSAISGAAGAFALQNGLARKELFSDMLMSTVNIYLVQNSRLVSANRTVAWKDNNHPAALFDMLAKGALPLERDQGTGSPLVDGLDGSDLIGLAVDGADLLINLSPRCERLLRQAGDEMEQFACYSIVTTLCENTNTNRALFYFDSDTEEMLGGKLYWGGAFYLNYSITN